MLTIGLLGALLIRSRNAEFTVDGLKGRNLLAALLIRGNRIVPSEHLMVELWGDDPPRKVDNALQAHVCRLRAELSAWSGHTGARLSLRTSYPGYLLEVPEQSLDVRRFRRQCARAHALKTTDPHEAAGLYRRALALWRGPFLEDVPSGPIRDAEAEQLDQERLLAATRLTELELHLGRHLEVIPRLERLVLENPLEERLSAQLMVALDRAGRTSDALQIYARARLRLAEEAGLSPSAALERTMNSILGSADRT